jgi:hypothetical protein
MGREVSTKTAALVLVVFIGLIASWAYFNTQSLLVDSPSFIKVNPTGNLVFQLGSHYYETSPDGIDVQHFALADAGISGTVGDFDFFNNGDMLLYANTYQPSFIESMETFFRVAGTDTRQGIDGEGFYRCEVRQATCVQFGGDLPVFTRGFRLTIDPDDNVYIADTSRHRVIKVNASGRQVATLADGLKFPNDLLWEEGVLHIVNTNHHEVLSVNASTNGFGDMFSRVTPNIPQRNFPAEIEKSESSWLVVAMDNAMQNGKLGELGIDGNELTLAEVERGADILTLAKTGNSLILSDVKHLKYRRINSQTLQAESDFSSPLIAEHLARSKAEAGRYNAISWSVIGFGVLGFIVLAYFAIKSEIKAIDTDLEPISDDLSLDAALPDGAAEYWLPNSKAFVRAQKTTRWVMPIGIIMLLALLLPLLLKPNASMLLAMPVGLFLVMMYFSQKMLENAAKLGLGVTEKGVMIRDIRGSTYQGKGQEVGYSRSTICLDKASVTIKIFDPDEYEKWVKPRLRNSTCLNESQVLLKQFKGRHPMLMETLKVTVAMLLIIVLLEFL